jgi:hypothetical protein
MSDEHDGTPTEPSATPATGADPDVPAPTPEETSATDVTEPIATSAADGPTEPTPAMPSTSQAPGAASATAVTAESPAPPPPPGPPAAGGASGWSRPSGVPVLTLALGALLIGVLAFGIGVFAGRSSAEASGRDGGGWMRVGDGRHEGAMPGGGMAPGMPGATLPGNGAGSIPGMPGIGAGGIGGIPGNWAVTAGTVVSVDGDTIVVDSVKGNTVTIHTSDATSIRIVRDQGQDGADGVAKGDDIVAAGTPGDQDLTIDAVQIMAGDLPWIRSIGEAGSNASGGSIGSSSSTSAAGATTN